MNGSENASLQSLHTLLLDSCGKTTLLLLFVWSVVFCFRRTGAAQQHFLWLCALLGVVYVTAPAFLVVMCSAVGLRSARTTLPMRMWQSPDLKRVVAVPPLVPSAGTTVYNSAPSTSVVRRNVMLPVNDACVPALMMIWLFGSLVTLICFAFHSRAVWLLQSRSIPLKSAEMHACLAQIAARIGVSRSPVLLQTVGNALSPLTWGWIHTFLLLPEENKIWPQERLQAVLLHELAHIKRGDWFTQRIADAICALFWFHPLVWLTAKKMRECAERACDDMALIHGIAPENYARHLLDMAQILRAHTANNAITLPFLRVSQLETRLRAVLDGTASRRTFSHLGRYTILAICALGLLPFALAMPVTTQNVKYVDANVIIAVHSKALLPGGVAIELLGLADTDAGAKAPTQWWLPDGATTAAPYDLTNAFRIQDTEENHRVQRIFGVRISGIPEQNPDTVRELLLDDRNKPGHHEILSSHGEVYENHLQVKGNSRYTVTRTDYFGSVHLPERGTFRYGVALGDWHKVATADPTLQTIRTTVNSARVRFKKAINKAYIMKLPDGGKTIGMTIETQDNLGRVARRLVAITRQGKSVKIDSIFSGPEGAMTPYTCLFPEGLALEDVREFRLQTRPYTWAEFPNIALSPLQ